MASRTDASTNILGFKYQEMVALLKCLDAKDETKIYLECYGDISDEKAIIESKHSTDPDKELYDTHIDFWKTLSNLVVNYDEVKDFTSYILHTTASIRKDSIFENWDKLKPQEKKDKVYKVINTSDNITNIKYYYRIKNIDIVKLYEILGKFTIQSSQPAAKEFYKERLLKHSTTINDIKENNREEFINSLLGYISSELIKNEQYIWKIDIEIFRNYRKSILKNYLIEDLIFPIYKAELNREEENLNYRFVEEIKNIKYDTRIGEAINDYLNAQKSMMDIISKRPILGKELNDFDEEILTELRENKTVHQDELRNEKILDVDYKSRRFFDDCINQIKIKKDIRGICNVKTYYPKGRVHYQVEENKDFTWKLDQ